VKKNKKRKAKTRKLGVIGEGEGKEIVLFEKDN
jgi:hypothetical protein